MLDGPLSDTTIFEGLVRAILAMFGIPLAFMLIACLVWFLTQRRDDL